MAEQNSSECRIGRMTLMNENDAIFGNITIEDESYLIQDLDNKVRVLCKVNHEYYSKKACPMGKIEGLEDPKSNSISEGERTNTSAVCKVKTLILYTQGALNRVSNINHSISLALAQTNQAYANSAIGNNVELVQSGVFQVDFNETNPSLNDINTLVAGNSFSTTGQTVMQLRNNMSADIVVMFCNETGWGGVIGRVAAIGPNSTQAFGIFDALDATSAGLVFVHEVGHLFGARHEPCTALDAGANCDPEVPIQHAHVFKTGSLLNKKRRFTIMHSTEIDRIIQNYSNLNVTFDGESTGTSSRNNAQQHTNTACILAGFRPDLPNLFVTISGTVSACQCHSVNLCIPNYTGISSIQWQTSMTGAFNSYGNVVGTTNCYSATASCVLGAKRYIKVTISTADGRSYSAYHVLTAVMGPQCNPSALSSDGSIGNGIDCYPNPATNRVMANFTLPYSNSTDIFLFDANGRLVSSIL